MRKTLFACLVFGFMGGFSVVFGTAYFGEAIGVGNGEGDGD